MAADTDLNPGEAQARRLEHVGAQVTTLLRQPEVAQRLRATPGENEWSAMQTVGHMAEMIPYWMDHCHRLIAAKAEPPQFGRTLDATERLAGVELGAIGQPDELLQSLNHEVDVAAQTIRHMSPTDWGKTGIHLRHGKMTVAEVVEQLVVAHAEEHLAQVRAALQR